MKTKVVILSFIACFIFTLSIHANEPVPASEKVARSVARLIHKEMPYPDFGYNEQLKCCAAVKVEIQEDGSFEVVCLNCPDPRLKKHVESQIENIRSEKHAKYAGQTVMIKINFSFV